MARIYSSRMKQTLVSVAIAISGFSPKSETIVGSNAAYAQPPYMPDVPQYVFPSQRNPAPNIQYIPVYELPPLSHSQKKDAGMCQFYLKRLKTGNVPERVDAVRSVYFSCRHESKEDQGISALIGALKDSNPKVRTNAAEVLGFIDYPRVPTGIGGYTNPNPSLHKVFTALLETLNDDKRPTVRKSAIAALKTIDAGYGNPKLLAKLRDVSQNDPDKGVRAAAAEAEKEMANNANK